MVSGLDAVVNVSMHSEGRYSFVELRTPEMATAALQLSGQVTHTPSTSCKPRLLSGRMGALSMLLRISAATSLLSYVRMLLSLLTK